MPPKKDETSTPSAKPGTGAKPTPTATGDPPKPTAAKKGATTNTNARAPATTAGSSTAKSTPTATGDPPKPAAAKKSTTTNANPRATATTAGSSSGNQLWDLQRFSMYGIDENKKSYEYSSNSVEFLFVANCYYIALLALGRSDTQTAFQKLGESCVDHWTSRKYREENPTFEWQGDRSQIGTYVKRFTEGVTYLPPAIIVDPDLEGVYAAHGRRADYDGNFEIFRTRKCFRIKVPVDLVKAIKIANDTKAANPEYLLTLRMLLALAIWHEMTHGYVSYIAGAYYMRTPPQNAPGFVKPPPTVVTGRSAVGESGDFMECEIWGGSMQITDYPSTDPAHTNRGTLFAIDNNGNERAIGINTVKAFLKNPGGYNLKNAVLAVRSRSPSPEPPAPKRRKVTSTTSTEPRNKVVAWNVRFHYSPDNTPISIDKETVIVT